MTCFSLRGALIEPPRFLGAGYHRGGDGTIYPRESGGI